MTKKAAGETPDEPIKPKTVFSATGRTPEGLKWGELVVEDTTWRLRQTTVDEGDEAWDAAYDESSKKFNGRLNSRMNLAASIIEPPTSVDDMGSWSGVKYLALQRAYDELNTLPEADTEGN